MVVFGFLPQNFGGWEGPINAILSFFYCTLSGGDIQILHAVIERI